MAVAGLTKGLDAESRLVSISLRDAACAKGTLGRHGNTAEQTAVHHPVADPGTETQQIHCT